MPYGIQLRSLIGLRRHTFVTTKCPESDITLRTNTLDTTSVGGRRYLHVTVELAVIDAELPALMVLNLETCISMWDVTVYRYRTTGQRWCSVHTV